MPIQDLLNLYGYGNAVSLEEEEEEEDEDDEEEEDGEDEDDDEEAEDIVNDESSRGAVQSKRNKVSIQMFPTDMASLGVVHVCCLHIWKTAMYKYSECGEMVLKFYPCMLFLIKAVNYQSEVVFTDLPFFNE